MSETVEVGENESHNKQLDTSITSSQPLPKERKLRSPVWADFTKLKSDDGKVTAVCNYCKAKLSGSSKSGMSHLKNHIEICTYARVAKKKIEKGQQLIVLGDKKEDGTSSIGNFTFNQELSRDGLTRMLIYHEYPFSIVEHSFFREFCRNLNPKFKPLTRNTKKSDCLKMFEIEKEKIYKSLAHISSKVSVTSDMWTSRTMDGYMCLTCHYIDEEWKLQKKILNFVKVEAPHTGELIAKTIIQKLYDWNIDAKVYSIVLDNATTNDVVVRELLKVLSSNNTLYAHGDLFHMRCSAHILNLVVQDGLEQIRGIIHNVRESIKFVKSSQERLERFKKVATQVQAPQKSLFYDVPTRWNSTYLMLENAISFRDAFTRLAQVDDKYKYAPSFQAWENVKSVMDCLKVFYDITLRISGTKYPTSNIYFNEFCDIYLSINDWLNSSHAFIADMALSMLTKFKKYWSITNKVLAFASILDPRYKLISISYFFKLMYGDEAELKILEIKDSLTSLYNEYANCRSLLLGGSLSNVNEMPSQGLSQSSSSSRKRGLSDYIMRTSLSLPQKSGLELYLEENVCPGIDDEHFDILAWWKSNGPKYPIVALMAKDILGIPISTVASESTFSTGGRVLDEYRSSLTPKTIEALVCTQDWLRDQAKVLASSELTTPYSSVTLAPEEDREFDPYVTPLSVEGSLSI